MSSKNNRVIFDVVISGSFGFGNLGDDALMVAFDKLFRESHQYSKIGIISKGPKFDYITKFTPEAELLPDTDREDRIITCKTKVFGGGTQWFSFPGIPPNKDLFFRSTNKLRSGFNKVKKFIYPNSNSIQWETDRKILNVQKGNLIINHDNAIAASIGLGPFLAGGENKAIHDLSSCTYLAIRDRKGFEWCQKWGLNQAKLRADICYIKELWGGEEFSNKTLKSTSNRIAIIVRDWPYTKEGSSYYKPLIKAVRKISNEGFDITFFLFSDLKDIYWKEYLQRDGRHVYIWKPHNYENIMGFLKNLIHFDIVVSARYHGLVFASTFGIPCIAIEVEPKLTLAAETLGKGCELWRQPFRTSDLVGLISSIYSNKNLHTKAMISEMEHQRALALLMKNEIKNKIR